MGYLDKSVTTHRVIQCIIGLLQFSMTVAVLYVNTSADAWVLAFAALFFPYALLKSLPIFITIVKTVGFKDVDLSALISGNNQYQFFPTISVVSTNETNNYRYYNALASIYSYASMISFRRSKQDFQNNDQNDGNRNDYVGVEMVDHPAQQENEEFSQIVHNKETAQDMSSSPDFIERNPLPRNLHRPSLQRNDRISSHDQLTIEVPVSLTLELSSSPDFIEENPLPRNVPRTSVTRRQHITPHDELTIESSDECPVASPSAVETIESIYNFNETAEGRQSLGNELPSTEFPSPLQPPALPPLSQQAVPSVTVEYKKLTPEIYSRTTRFPDSVGAVPRGFRSHNTRMSTSSRFSESNTEDRDRPSEGFGMSDVSRQPPSTRTSTEKSRGQGCCVS